jgi:hypothetical protein
MKLRSILLAFLFVASSGLAADVDGKWSGTLSMQGSDFPVSFTFKADGAALSGSTTGPDGTEIKIADGKVDGNNLSFSVSFDFGGMPLTITYKGVLSGQEIKLAMDIQGMPAEVTVKKTT